MLNSETFLRRKKKKANDIINMGLKRELENVESVVTPRFLTTDLAETEKQFELKKL